MRTSRRHHAITLLAQRYGRNHMRRDGGTTPNAGMGAAAYASQVSHYMRNWLAEHGELPTGEHLLTGRLPMACFAVPVFVVDFDKLAADRNYPAGPPAPPDHAKSDEVMRAMGWK